MTFTPTPEQTAIIEAARGSSDNLIIHALAGAAKTSTLVLIAKALSSTFILALSFNTRIRDEMKQRLPGNCEAMTLNGIGHRAWGNTIGRRLTIDKDKVYKIVSKLVEDLDAAEKGEAFGSLSEIMKAVENGKTCGYLPTGKFSMGTGLMNDEDFFDDWLDEPPTELFRTLVREATIQSIEQAFHGICDYNDQLFMPTIFPATFPAYPLVLVDEAQDLSSLNHAMLRKIVKKRLIAVGDENQSIYGFRGAHQNSMNLLRKTFNMKRMDLSISFRCPIAVVKEARWRAPSMQWPEWAKEGSVQTVVPWNVDLIPHDAVIICRNNAPIFRCAVRLLKNGRYPEIVGQDIGKALIKIMKKLGPLTTPRSAAIALLAEWLEKKREVSRDYAKAVDQAECIGVFLEQGETIGDSIAYAEHILTMAGSTKLMTGHKAKGLEFDNVFILDRGLIRMNEDQDRNLLYVMITRAKDRLTYISLDHFEGE